VFEIDFGADPALARIVNHNSVRFGANGAVKLPAEDAGMS